MSGEHDELAALIENAYDLNDGMVTFELLAHAILAAGYRRIDHTEYALDHKSSDLQFTDDEGDLWTDEDYVKHYASEYGDTAPLMKRHVTEWEAAQ